MGRRFRRRLKHTLAYLAVLGVRFLLEHLPRHIALRLGERGGRWAYRALRMARRRTQEHIRMALGLRGPELRRLSERVFQELGRNLAEFLRLRALLREGLEGVVRTEGLGNLDRALAEGRGVVVITGHLGNWEILGAYLARRGYPLWAVGRRLFDRRIDGLVVEHREMAGVHNIPRGEDARALVRILRGGGVLGLLMDQDTEVQGVFAPFFGRPAYTPAGPVKLAMRTGAPIVPMALYREREGYRLVVLPSVSLPDTGDREADLREGVARCNRVLEALVRMHPEQWVWMHRRWRTKPERYSLEMRCAGGR